MSSVSEITIRAYFSLENCDQCSSTFWVDADTMKHRRQNGLSYWCPACGTKWTFTESDNTRLRRFLDAERNSHRNTRHRLESSERSASATRGHLTRARKRAANGMCPCCKRTFTNVVRHMKNKHPDYEAE